jgi:hypothetical protein
MAIFASNLAPASTDRALGAVDVQRSLKFNDDDSAHLTRTPSSAGNRKTWTLSVWVKRTTIDANQRIFTAYDGSNVNAECNIQFQSDGKIQINNNNTSSNTDTNLKTNRLFRDSSAWYHIVIGTDMTQGTASNRVNLYINGVQETSFSTESYGTQNVDWWFNNNSQQTIGRRHNTTERPFDGYMAEFNFIDGSQLDPSYFGFTESQTGIWMPKRYEGTYGTNGFYLDFSDNSSAAALGIDKSPNGNDFAPQSFSVSGTDNDSLIDTPTNNFPVLSNLYGPVNTTFGEANLLMRGGDNFAASTFLLPKSGKWYAEFVKYNNGAAQSISVTRANTAQTNYAGYLGLADNVEYVSNGEVGNRTRGSSSPPDAPTWTDDAGVVVAVAVDMDNGAVYFARNNTYINSGVPTSGSAKTGAIATDLLTDNGGDHVIAVHGYNANNSYGMYANFGQRPFTYTPPAGYKSLCTKNISPNVPSLVRPKRHFDTLLWTGTGSSNIVEGLEFSPDLAWVKVRNNTGDYLLIDQIRGGDQYVSSNNNDAEASLANRDATFYPNGIRWNGNSLSCNESGKTYVGWFWKAGGSSNTFNVDDVGYASASAAGITDGSIALTGASVNQEAGFSMVLYTGTGSLGTVGHGLNGTPEMIWTKSRSATGDWGVLETAVNTTAENRIHLNDNGGYISYQGYKLWGDTVPTSSVFTVREDTATNASGVTYVAYCWRSIPGYSKIGKYTGNGNTDGRFVYIGFRPAFVLLKRTSASAAWVVHDNKRAGYNGDNDYLHPDQNLAESDGSTGTIDFLSNGFKLRMTAGTHNDGTFVYMAFAEEPGTTPFDTFPNAR